MIDPHFLIVDNLGSTAIMLLNQLLKKYLYYTRLPVTRWVKFRLNFDSQSRVSM